ncbi:polysaccharide biosynthesis protein [Legionella londiniensis]|uniref:Putative nucleoside-diphosphate sugar epimerase n=1 Tax=Legionella londiniensis TaxID=45068 RepID=A0A0W0VLK4_9GAMM|nr:putative nucleoside-diphosphate sugar epimerase [Legionella londiniensis]STX92817.1 nucleoside-diphosphate sugar epimerases [Legionella londiniensis]
MKKMVFYWQKIYPKLPVLAFDILSIPVAWYMAYWLRYNMQPFPVSLTQPQILAALAMVATVQIACYYYFKVYRGLWRFSSLSDLTRILRAAISATILSIPVLYLSTLLHDIPRSVLPLYCMVLITLLCSGRLLLRSYWDQKIVSAAQDGIKRVLIIGAGQAGEGLVRDLKRTHSYLPVGFIDDNPGKRGLEVHGVRVLGSIRDMPDLVQLHLVDLIFIAIPSARSAAMRRIVNYCEQCQVPFRTLPSIQALVSGRVEVNALREVRIEDLLGRDQVELNWDKIALSVNEKRVLVTGGGGSIGSELCRQILTLAPGLLIILDNSEYNLYKIDLELRELFPDKRIELALVNVTDAVAVEELFRKFSPQVVFHAASFKHVPMLETQIRVAVHNNVLGTQIIADASAAHGVEKFILISTDKAVNPTNVMGASKRAAEIYCQNLDARVATQFITVRFGNVLGSVGSVVPLFQKQLQNGGPLTVTHPEIQRYFMTVSEACQLILQAMVNGEGGEIFVLDMGEPVKITYLAEQMIRLAGKEPGKDIAITYTGLRPGEKLFEELFHASEQLEQTAHEKLFKAKFRQIEWKELVEIFRMLNRACVLHQDDELLILLKNLIPEFHCKSLGQRFSSFKESLLPNEIQLNNKS